MVNNPFYQSYGQFGIIFPSAFLKILKLLEYKKGNFKIFKNHEGHLSQKSTEPNMFFVVHSYYKFFLVHSYYKILQKGVSLFSLCGF